MDQRQIIVEGSSRSIMDARYTGALVEKWGEYISDYPDRTEHQRYIRAATAMLLENQTAYVREELQPKMLTEDVTTANVGGFTKFAFPALLRAVPNMIGPEISSFQPIAAPYGAIFYLDSVYASSKGRINAGDVFPREFDSTYTSEEVDGERVTTGDGVNFSGAGTFLTANLAWHPVHKPSSDRGMSVVIRELNAATGATVQEGRFLASGAFDPTSAFASGTINFSNGAIAGVKFNAIPANGNPIVASYWFDGEANSMQPRMALDVKKALVEVQNRRMKLIFSSEAADDLRALHGIDAEAYLVSMGSQQFALEMDREIIRKQFLASTGTTGTFDRIPPAGIAEIDHLRSMITSLSRVSNAIHTKTQRGPANYMVTSPQVSALMEQLTTHGDYRPIYTSGVEYGAAMDAPRPLSRHGQFGIYRAGTLQSKWMVYVDPMFANDMVLMGLKGDNFLETGSVLAMYTPLTLTSLFVDPADFTMRKGLRSRYIFKVVRPEFYGQLRVLNV